jgi:uncharacterized protein YmfQ (DUF2313 family)
MTTRGGRSAEDGGRDGLGDGYNRRVASKPLAEDTDPETERRQIERWRRMTPDEKADEVSRLTQEAREAETAAMRERHPSASEREIFLRLAIARLGYDLASKAYAEILQLNLRDE